MKKYIGIDPGVHGGIAQYPHRPQRASDGDPTYRVCSKTDGKIIEAQTR